MNVTVFMIFNFSVLSSILRINLIAVMNRHKNKYEKYSWDQNQWPKSMKFTILVACLVEEFIKICLLVIIHLLNYGRFLLEAMEFFRRKNIIQVAGCCRSAKVKFIFFFSKIHAKQLSEWKTCEMQQNHYFLVKYQVIYEIFRLEDGSCFV